MGEENEWGGLSPRKKSERFVSRAGACGKEENEREQREEKSGEGCVPRDRDRRKKKRKRKRESARFNEPWEKHDCGTPPG